MGLKLKMCSKGENNQNGYQLNSIRKYDRSIHQL